MIKTGIIDENATLTGELLRLLSLHPEVDTIAIQNPSRAGQPLTKYYPDLIGDIETEYCTSIDINEIDILFCCFNPGAMRRQLDEEQFPEKLAVIDFSGDFRIESPGHNFIYGLPELNRKRIVRGESRYIAIPDASASIIQLALLPLAKNLLLRNAIQAAITIAHPHAKGICPLPSFSKQLLPEITQNLVTLQNSFTYDINIMSTQVPLSRSLLASIWTESPNISIDFVRDLYTTYYDDHSFVHIVDKQPCTAQVINTNKCFLHIDISDGKLIVTAVCDALLKGAAGQAIHCMNLLFGLKETTGLFLKSPIY